MKVGLVTKLDKKNTIKSKKFDDDVMLVNYDVIINFPIENKTKNLKHISHTTALSKGTIFAKICFVKKC